MSHDASTDVFRLERIAIPSGHAVARLRWGGLGVGVVGSAATFLLSARDGSTSGASWLVAFLFFLSLALGALAFVLIHFAMQGGWGIVVRRLAENTMATLPMFLVLFVPVAASMSSLFPWARGPAHGDDTLLQWKAPYLNTPFFLLRAGVFFACWSGIAIAYRSASRRQDSSGDLGISRTLRRWSGPCIVVLGLTQTFAAVDWIMSLDPHWYSTIFGVYWFAGSLVSFFAMLTLVVLALRRAGYLAELVGPEHLHDLGKLLFAFTVFWAYIGFSQYFLIWYGNIPEETVFFRERAHGSWAAASMLLAVGHFVVPFFFLMPRSIKRNAGALAAGAAWLLSMHLVDVYWLVMPVFRPEGVGVGWEDLAAFLSIGGFFSAAVAAWTVGAPLVPLRDPRLSESVSFENA